jgi:hypothetical protein
MASANSAQGIIAAIGSYTIGKVTKYDLTQGYVVLDDTTLSDTRENNQAGIITVSGSIDCLGDETASVLGAVGNLVLSGTKTKDYGDVICTEVGDGASVKGQRTTRYTVMSSVAT